jgi:hypothetical protein
MRCPHCNGELYAVVLKVVDRDAEPAPSSPDLPEWEALALDMLQESKAAGERKLNPWLHAQLREIDALCQRTGGRLRSRQAIAVCIRAWQAANPSFLPTVPR